MRIKGTTHLQLFVLLIVTIPSVIAKVKNKISLQWSICDSDPNTVLRKLGEDIRDPDKLDPISYYDSQPPVYVPQGLMFRTKTRGGREISVVKARHSEDTKDVPHGVTCLWDRYGDDIYFVCSKQSHVKRSRLWSRKQIDLAENFTQVAWDELKQYGPYLNPKWKHLTIEGYKAVFDDVAADRHHLMELEVKVPISEGRLVYQIITGHLEKCAVVLCKHQESKAMRLFREMGFRIEDADVLMTPVGDAQGTLY
ncbi:hypothetical protein MGYG_08568 [Nannizzia gypsea CBS 118893]|uniref:Uncharacterized protein n=1 Tax=Arthroderma gypseum (strain ATCC MYA-4604 / CBS 118893) TaxID=535722 RepID=E4V627_ARTGP|nr:hypothetical protein MGYG_08568 [Nannizzia gypsea CBS 118893]EFR05552.1 hypothetical protein MGYG_08568 [Nannizzia gypsea CBS 118893]